MAQPSQEQIQAKFELGVSITIFNWPALTLAVQNQWGGPDSSAKREWLAGVISDMFTDRPGTDLEDVETTLLQVMVDEFEVNVDDDSAYEVAQQVMRLRTSTLQADFAEVDELYSSWLTRGGSSRVQFQQVEADDGEEETESSDEEEDADMNDNVDALPARPTKEREPPPVDEDGFTKVVRKTR